MQILDETFQGNVNQVLFIQSFKFECMAWQEAVSRSEYKTFAGGDNGKIRHFQPCIKYFQSRQRHFSSVKRGSVKIKVDWMITAAGEE